MKLRILLVAFSISVATLFAQDASRLNKLIDGQRNAFESKKKALALIESGASLLKEQKYKDAASSYLAALELDPSNSAAYFSFATALSGSGRIDESRRILTVLFEFATPEEKSAMNSKFGAERWPGGAFAGFSSAYSKQTLAGNGWGAAPDDLEGIVTKKESGFYTLVHAKASEDAIRGNSSGMMQSTCRRSATLVGATSVLESLARSALREAKKENGTVTMGSYSCTIANGSASCSGVVRGHSILECSGRGPGGSYAECDCTVYLPVQQGKTSVKVD